MGTSTTGDKKLFIACFIALISTAFGFIVRAMIMNTWAEEFGLTATQKGEIFGVGLWPFAISIVVFSLFIDRIGYGKAMAFAFVCHIASAIITICAPFVLAGDGASVAEVDQGKFLGYWVLYFGNFVVALGNGTVEAVINPVVATMFSKEKTKWLNILHAGWPGGLVAGGLIVIGMSWAAGGFNMNFTGGEAQPIMDAMPSLDNWQLKVGLLFIPTILYGILMLSCKFPVSERVEAGVSDFEMLREVGFAGALVILAMITWELTRVIEVMSARILDWNIHFDDWMKLGITLALAGGFGAYTRSIGRPIFVFFMLIMIPLATTELGTDSWITPLMEHEMNQVGWHPGWVLVYTSFIMMVLRFRAGPIVHRLSPLGLLCASSVIAAIGLVCISNAEGLLLLFLAATVYGFGKTFFWPTMLGVTAEQFPKGGALTLNTMGAVGMLGVGVIGAPFMGYIQNTELDSQLKAKDPTIYEQVINPEEQPWVLSFAFGEYRAVDEKKLAAEPEAVQTKVKDLINSISKESLTTMAIFPCIMLGCYLILVLYFKSKGGYKAEVLTGHEAEDEKFTGGVEGPVE